MASEISRPLEGFVDSLVLVETLFDLPGGLGFEEEVPDERLPSGNHCTLPTVPSFETAL